MKKRITRFLSLLRNAFKELVRGETEIEKPKQEAQALVSELVEERSVEVANNATPPLPLGQGLSCPSCAHKIPISMEILLGGKVICPNCLLQLKVDTQQSAETLAALKQLQKGFDKANEKRNNF